MYEFFLSLWLNTKSIKNDYLAGINKLYIAPIENTIEKKQEINWKSWIVFDLKGSKILWWKNENTKFPIASLTKLMTAFLIIENHKLDEIVSISRKASLTQWAVIWTYEWEQFTVKDLLKWLLIRSWNDAAVALAEFHSWDIKSFVKEMNNKAKELWLKNTNFENPSWFDSKMHYSSAKDLAFLTKFVLKNNFIKEIVSYKETIIFSKEWRQIKIKSTNHLLWWEIKWVKTWTTQAAWECLITLIEKDQKELLFVLLWSSNRFSTTKELINFVFNEI